MRLHLLLPKVNPDQITPPTTCADPKCRGRKFRFHQPESLAWRETAYQEVQAHRYQCLKCGRTFRVYPEASEFSADLAAGQRTGCGALSAGVKLWSDLIGVRGHRRLDV